MTNNIFINAQELADELGVSKAMAYKMIKGWNERLEQMGYTTVRGRVSRKFYLEQMYGMAERKEEYVDRKCREAESIAHPALSAILSTLTTSTTYLNTVFK